VEKNRRLGIKTRLFQNDRETGVFLNPWHVLVPTDSTIHGIYGLKVNKFPGHSGRAKNILFVTKNSKRMNFYV